MSMKIRLPVYLRDRTGWVRPRVVPSALNVVLVSAAAGLAAGVSLSLRDTPFWAALTLGLLVGIVCLWILTQRQTGEWARQGVLLYRQARLRYALNTLLLTDPGKWDTLLPPSLKGDDTAFILHDAPKTEISHLLPALREGKRVLYLSAPLSEEAVAFMQTPPAPAVETHVPEDYADRLLAVFPHLPKEALSFYASWARSNTASGAGPGRWLAKSRVLRLFWVAAMLWLVSGWTHLRLWYRTVAVLLALAALAWALWPWARKRYQAHSNRSAVSP